MHWDYVDIGTCDFDTSANHAPTAKVLLVEPLDFYLNKFVNIPNVTLCNCAVGAMNTEIDIYYLTEDKIKEYELPDFIRGCNSVGQPHKLTNSYLKDRNINEDVYEKRTVPIVTFSKLCRQYDISSIGQLKLDTEGHDHFIIPDVFEFVQTNTIKTIIIEYQHYAGNTNVLDQWFYKFKLLGYKGSMFGSIDYKLEKI